jgi:hypothetical protein
MGTIKALPYPNSQSMETPPQCTNLQAAQVSSLIELMQSEPMLRAQQNTSIVETSLKKALSPKFEIVFAGL